MAGSGFTIRDTAVSELPDGATITVIGYREDGTIYEQADIQLVGGVATFERTAGEVASWPDTIRVEIVATTAQGAESRASTPTLVRVIESNLPAITEPLPGTTLDSRQPRFAWTFGDDETVAFDLHVSATAFPPTAYKYGEILDTVNIGAVAEYTPTGGELLPNDGSTVYIRLHYSKTGGDFGTNAEIISEGRFIDWTVTAFNDPNPNTRATSGQSRAGMSTIDIPSVAMAENTITSNDLAAWSGLPVLANVGTEYASITSVAELRHRMAPTGNQSTRYENRLNLTDNRTYRLSQRILFETGFDFRNGGKCGWGLRSDVDSSGGLAKPDGWSVRPTWGARDGSIGESSAGAKDGTIIAPELEIYVYDNVTTGYGRAETLLSIVENVEYWVDIEVTVNSTFGASDGSIRAWVNGTLLHSETGTKFQSEGVGPLVQQLRYIAFHGGSGADWVPETTGYLITSDVAFAPGAWA